MFRMLQSVAVACALRQPRTQPTVAGAVDRTTPFPPGDYPVVVVGSGPGGIQTSLLPAPARASSTRSSRPTRRPGGMFRRFPFFQRLLSWTKPYAPVPRTTRASTSGTTGTACWPSSPRTARSCRASWTARRSSRRGRRWSAGLRHVRRAAGVAVRYDTPWESHRRATASASCSTPATATTAAGASIFAVGVAEPWMPDTPGIEHVAHYVDTRDAATYAGQAALHHRQAEQRLRARQRPAPVGQPHHPRLAAAGQAVGQHALAGRRPRALRPAVGGLRTWAAACSSSTPRSSASSAAATAVTVHTRRSDNGEAFVAEVDEVIAATGFTCPLARPDRPRASPSSGRAACRP